ncbi:MAG: polyphosphate polymerase domain-containing protein [Mangrovibacterium sp.]
MYTNPDAAIRPKLEPEGPELLKTFTPISLADMEQVTLMNRFDSKYQVHARLLPFLLKFLSPDYFILEIDGTREQTYRTMYFDTAENRFYLAHHNGKQNRIKIRKREYENSGLVFLEIKSKSNKGKTSKIRIPADAFTPVLSDREKDFINSACGHSADELMLKSFNHFSRITLVSKQMNERCTIDTSLLFESMHTCRTVRDLVIIELKQECNGKNTRLANWLKAGRVYPRGFSKYCIGRVFTEPQLKRNNFKPTILSLEKSWHKAEHAPAIWNLTPDGAAQFARSQLSAAF